MSIFKKITFIFIAFFFLFFPFSAKAIDGNSSIGAMVTNIVEEKEIEVMGKKQLFQKLEVKSLDGEKKIIIENGNEPLANVLRYKINDKILVVEGKDVEGNSYYYISDFIRSEAIIYLTIIFVILLLVVAGVKGLMSLLAMGVTFMVIFLFMLPRILAGNNPVLIAMISALFIIPVTFYMAHGINKKTTVAVVSSVITLIIATVLGSIFIELGHLSGLSSEEAGMLALDKSNLYMKGILLAGLVVGTLGVLDDITVSQTAIVEELITTASLKKASDLYSRSMVIGKDHITSMVNTLVLAYAGAAMPLLLIFINNPHPFSEIVNYEMIAEEIIRTLVGSIALILAVPISSFLAANWKRD